MIRFDLAARAREAGVRRSRVVLRPVSPSRRAEREYRSVLLKLVDGIAAQVRELVVPVVREELAADRMATAGARGPAETKANGPKVQYTLNQINQFIAAMEASATTMADRIFTAEAERHTAQWPAVIRSAIGIDVSQIIASSDLTAALAVASLKNASLIKAVSQSVVDKVSASTFQALADGQTMKDYTAQLEKDIGFGHNRAKLIARNEIGSLNAQMNQLRHEQAGIKSYVWMTSLDERVRPLHASLNGQTFEYGKPTPAEGGRHPGQPINCRCVARAVVEFPEWEELTPTEPKPKKPKAPPKPKDWSKESDFKQGKTWGKFGSGQIPEPPTGGAWQVVNPVPVWNLPVSTIIPDVGTWSKKLAPLAKEVVLNTQDIAHFAPNVGHQFLKPIADWTKEQPIRVFKLNGRLLAVDSSDGLASAWIQGNKHIKGYLIDLDDPANVSLVDWKALAKAASPPPGLKQVTSAEAFATILNDKPFSKAAPTKPKKPKAPPKPKVPPPPAPPVPMPAPGPGKAPGWDPKYVEVAGESGYRKLGKMNRKLSQQEERAGLSYQGSGYIGISGRLREGKDDFYRPGLDAAVRTWRDGDLKVYRGVRLRKGRFLGLRPSELKGAVLREFGYSSFSTARGTSVGFAGGAKDNAGILFELEWDSSTPALHMWQAGLRVHNEKELLTARGTEIHITSVYKNQNGEIVARGKVVVPKNDLPEPDQTNAKQVVTIPKETVDKMMESLKDRPKQLQNAARKLLEAGEAVEFSKLVGY